MSNTTDISSNVKIATHPLIQHKITQIRQPSCKKVEFMRISEEIGMLFAYEITKDLTLHNIEIDTPLEHMSASPEIDGIKPAIVAVLSAGMGLQRGLLDVMPEAKEGYIDMSRDEATLVADMGMNKLPRRLAERRIYVTEHMLATGGSSIGAISAIKEAGGKGRNIKFVVTCAAPEGLKALQEAHPDLGGIYIGVLDRELNEKGYILPGLGDAGDRLCGRL